MRVLLINPPREKEILGNNPSIIEEERGHNPPLGLLYIGSYLVRHSAHEVAVLDAQVEELTYPQVEQRIRSFGPDAVGITAMTLTLLDVLETVNTVKRVSRDIQVVLGGPHVHLFPEETIQLPGVDFLVLGEGELAFAELLEFMGDRERLRRVAGLVFKNDGVIIRTDNRPPIPDLDSLPFPARGLVPHMRYTSLLAKRDPVTTIFTSRGCPFPCSFCDRPHLGHGFRARSAGNVGDELEECTRMGIHEFLFYDDTFTINKSRVIAICDEVRRRKLDVGFDIRTRIDMVDETLLRALKMAGCQGIHYGVEAGTEKILKILKKHIRIEDAESIFALTRKVGIPSLAYFMIGNPSETREDIQKTFEVLKLLDPDYLHLTILTPFPGTELYLEGLRSGQIVRDHWREFARNPTPDFHPPHWDVLFTRGELERLLTQGYKSFYLRPGYIWRRLRSVRSFNELSKKAMAAVKLACMSSSVKTRLDSHGS